MNQLSDVGMELFNLLETKMGWKNIAQKPLCELYVCSLTSKDFMMNALQLYTFLMVVEEKYRIRVEKEDLQRFGFRTLQNIEMLINSKKL